MKDYTQICGGQIKTATLIKALEDDGHTVTKKFDPVVYKSHPGSKDCALRVIDDDDMAEIRVTLSTDSISCPAPYASTILREAADAIDERFGMEEE